MALIGCGEHRRKSVRFSRATGALGLAGAVRRSWVSRLARIVGLFRAVGLTGIVRHTDLGGLV